jgi:hypothetical protein
MSRGSLLTVSAAVAAVLIVSLFAVLLHGLATGRSSSGPESVTTPVTTVTPTAMPSPTLSPTSTVVPTPVTGPWHVVASPDPGTELGELKGIAAASATDLWAVGDTQTANGPTALIEQGDGTNWRITPSPTVGAGTTSALSAVAAVSSSDVWAVGAIGVGAEGSKTLTEHWDGTQWQTVASPNQGTMGSALFGIAAIASNDVWAAGYYVTGLGCGFVTQPLIARWDGTHWSIVPSPHIAGVGGVLNAISAPSVSDIWAVGNAGNAGLIEHYAGATWSIVSAPSGMNLLGVTGLAAGDAWAVGWTRTGPATAHWDGAHWTTVASPQTGPGQEMLAGISGVAANDLWAVGGNPPTGCGSASKPLIEHWNGQAWSIMTSADLASLAYGYLDAVVAVSANDVWAVGQVQGSSGGSNAHSLIVHYSA